jgi:hypothetical protein
LQQANTGLLSKLVEHAPKWIACLSEHGLNVFCHAAYRTDSQVNATTE